MGIAQSLQMDYLNNLHDSEGVVMPMQDNTMRLSNLVQHLYKGSFSEH